MNRRSPLAPCFATAALGAVLVAIVLALSGKPPIRDAAAPEQLARTRSTADPPAATLTRGGTRRDTERDRGTDPAAATAGAAARRRLPADLPLRTVSPGAPPTVAPGELLRLPAAGAGMPALHLTFAPARRGDRDYRVTLYAEHGAQRELAGIAQDGAVVITLNETGLTAGRYLLQLATREYTPTPVRRYVIEIP